MSRDKQKADHRSTLSRPKIRPLYRQSGGPAPEREDVTQVICPVCGCAEVHPNRRLTSEGFMRTKGPGLNRKQARIYFACENLHVWTVTFEAKQGHAIAYITIPESPHRSGAALYDELFPKPALGDAA